MYSSRGNSAYGQQSYGGQSGYAQNLGSAYTPSSVGGIDGGSQHSLASRHSSMLSGSQEADVGGYRGSTAHYGGQYGAIYGSASMTGSQQAPSMSAKVTGASALEGRGGYTSALPDSPKFSSGEYVPSSSHAYGHKSDQLYPEKIHDYSAIDRRQYGERQSAYMGMDIQSDTVSRYADSVGFSHQHQPGIYERIDQASLLRQEQLLKSQSVQSSSLDATSRQIDYLAARSTASRHPTQDLASYGGRMDADPRNSSMLSTSSYGGQHAPSILGAAPRRNVDDLLYPQSSSNPGYGVSLPPGRDYGTGKGLHGASLESDYRGGHSRIDERRDDRAGYLREFELREEERHRDLVREREKERDREKERERERDRERERKRERERILERREKERERERKRGLEIRRERTPPSASKDRRGTSVTKEARTLRRDSSSHETSHRRHSPVKEKRREYICKIHSSSLVDTERDYLSVDKRYPRLFISPEFSKVIVNWPKENLKLSIQTPVSFEHDFLEEDGVAELKESPSTNLSAQQLVKPEPGRTIWHAKILLMSGLSKNALEELSSEKCYDDRPLHVCNIMRFAVLKRDRSFMAIGGPWDPADGGDPSVDDSVLVQTALRYARDITQIDLKNCRNWNRFLEIHYDRFGSDGFFSHREITVLFVPDLSECLPSLETWRNQWLAHKRTVAERERQLILKRERSREKKEGQKDSSKDSKRTEKSEKTKEPTSAGVKKNDKDVKGKATAQKDDDSDKNSVNKDETETGEGAKKVVKEQGDTSGTQTTTIVKAGKKKIIRRIVKQKVAASKTTDAVTTAAKNNEDGKNAAENNEKSEISAEQNESSADPSGVKTFVRKKIIKKVQVGKSIENKDKGLQPEVTTEKVVEDKPKDNSETKSVALVQGSAVKTAVKKKIIKRVLKRKLTGGAATSEIKTDEKIVAQAGHETEKTGAQNVAKDVQKAEIKVILKSPTADKQTEIKAVKEEKKDGKEIDGKGSSGKKIEGAADKQKSIQKEDHDGKRVKSKDDEKSKDEKKDKDGKDEAKGKSTKDIKEKRLLEEPPKHPGVIFQLKGNKEAKLRSLSLSLDSLLDYSDNDIEESTFELSLFAESFYEMLQYEMASRILTFLQKLRIKFVTKRNQKKRLREEMEEKDKERNRSAKKLKTNELHVITKAVDPESTDHPEDQNTEKKKSTEKNQNTVKKEDVSVDKVNEEKLEEEIDYEEDPEEDPEEDEEMEDPEEDSSDEKTKEDEKPNLDVEDATVNGKEKEKEKAEENSKETKTEEAKPVSDIVSSEKKQDAKVESGKKEPSTVKEAVIDKELLQAFRFFDRNRTGYIRVEDMRLIIHNMRKYFSHRDVKELVQSALLETNTGRDNHILYGKLVRMTNI